MASIKVLLKILAFTCILVVSAAASSTPVSTKQPATGPDQGFRTAIQPDLTLKSVLATGTQMPQASASTTMAIKRGSCRCGCGGVCFSDADCGPGGVCDPFPSCCAKDTQINVFQQGVAFSSHKNGKPAVNVKCK